MSSTADEGALSQGSDHRADVIGQLSLDEDGVARSVSGDVNDDGIRLGFRKMRNAARFSVETSGRQNLFGRRARDRAVPEIPDAGDHNRRAIVAVGMGLNLGVCWNAHAD